MSIAQVSVAGVSIAGVPIASANMPDLQQPYSFPGAVSAYSWSPPKDGRWKFVGWGPGGSGGTINAGGSGGYFEITKALKTTDVVSITAGRAGTSDTSVSLPGGVTATATRAVFDVAGAATGGDVNLAGTAGAGTGAAGASGLGTGGGDGGPESGGADGGAGAPANLPYRGGQGGTGGAVSGSVGSGAGRTSAGSVAGGTGLVLAVYLGP